jgi:hypothetical protein
MNTALRILSLALSLTLGAQAFAQITTIDFEELTTCDRQNPPPFGSPCVEMTTQYASLGIVFQPSPYNPIALTESERDVPGFNPPYLVGQPSQYGDILVRFVDAANPSTFVARENVQFHAGGFNVIGNVTFRWLNANGVVIASQTNQSTYQSGYYETMVAPGPVGGFRIGITCTTLECELGGYDIDNIQFGAATFCLVAGQAHCDHNPAKDKDLGCPLTAWGIRAIRGAVTSMSPRPITQGRRSPFRATTTVASIWTSG